MSPFRLVALICLLILASLAPRSAAAQEIAPELETHALRSEARTVLGALVTTLTPHERARLIGLYLAVDANAADPSALAACDDDGDYVVVVSDAMLRFVDYAARAAAIADPGTSARKVAEYGASLAHSQLPGRRLLPPPPGFFGGPARAEDVGALRREALAFVLGRELEHLRQGDLICPHPTATKERGDDEWTAAEQRTALARATRIYAADARTRDLAAASRVLAAGGTGRGTIALLGVFMALEQTRRAATGFAPSYLRHHPKSAERMSTVRDAVTSPSLGQAQAGPVDI